jgi:hypothetical protein
LKRAAGKAPMLLSAVSGEGVAEVLRALMREIEGSGMSANLALPRGGGSARQRRGGVRFSI